MRRGSRGCSDPQPSQYIEPIQVVNSLEPEPWCIKMLPSTPTQFFLHNHMVLCRDTNTILPLQQQHLLQCKLFTKVFGN